MKKAPAKSAPKVGERIGEWVISRIHDWPRWWDLDLMREGKYGYLRVYK